MEETSESTVLVHSSGERIEFVRDDAESLEWIASWPPGWRRSGAHAHPRMAERWELLEGGASVRIGRETFVLTLGQVVEAPAGVEHLVWNHTDAPARVRVEMKPPYRWREFTERYFRGDDPMRLAMELPGHIVAGGQ